MNPEKSRSIEPVFAPLPTYDASSDDQALRKAVIQIGTESDPLYQSARAVELALINARKAGAKETRTLESALKVLIGRYQVMFDYLVALESHIQTTVSSKQPSHRLETARYALGLAKALSNTHTRFNKTLTDGN